MGWTILGILLAIVILLMVIVQVAVNYFMTFALCRETPKPNNLLGVDTPYEEPLKAEQKWIEEAEFTEYRRKSSDGLTLVAHWLPAEDAKRTVIFCHGWRGNWNGDLSPFARWLHDNGCHVLSIEERAQGQSEGDYITMGIRERQDLVDWVRWYRTQGLPEAPLYVMGISMGASTVLLASPLLTEEGISGLIADCGYTVPYDEFKALGWNYFHVPEFPVLKLLNHKFHKKTGLDLRSVSTLEALEKNKLPILFAHGKADSVVPLAMGQANYEACKTQKWQVLADNADHCMTFMAEPEAYKKALGELFAACEDA